VLLPLAIGHEIVGKVVSTGSEVVVVKKGDGVEVTAYI